jgi:hypothetical protein
MAFSDRDSHAQEEEHTNDVFHCCELVNAIILSRKRK